MWGHKKRGHLYKLSSFQVVGNPALSNCTECPRLRLWYTTPFRVQNIYTRAQTFTWQYLQCDSNFLRLKTEDNVCKRLYVSKPLVCRLRLADGDDTTMSGEDMRWAAYQLRCKDTEFLRNLHVLAQVFFSCLTPVPLSKGEGSRMLCGC